MILATLKQILTAVGGFSGGTAKVQVVNAAGTTVSTAELAKESGGNLATIAGKDFATATKQTDGTQLARAMGIEGANQRQLAVNASGKLTVVEDSASAIKTDLDNIYTRQADGNSKVQCCALPTVIPAHAYDTVDLTTAFAAGLLEADAGDVAYVVPSACFLSWLTLRVHTLTGAAAKITYYLAHDSDGLIPITEPREVTLSGYLSKTAGSYVIAGSLEVQYERLGGGGPYIIAKVDADTAKVVARLGHRLAR